MSALVWPSNKPSYFVYKPPSPNNSSKSWLNSFQLIYYQYLLHTGLYMLSWREQTTINAVVVVCAILSVYWLISAI